LRLGTCPDKRLAEELGCDNSLIAKLRKAYNIPKYDRVQRIVHLLGRMPDRELSRRTGIAAVTIAKRRKKMNIPPASMINVNGRTKVERYLRELKQQMES
jgi:transcriptional regulator with XRE-family HTH domain